MATCKTPSHENFKMLAVKPVDTEGKVIGDSFLAIDVAQAGVGDYVLVNTEGGSCSQVMGTELAAVNMGIVGVIDYIEIEGVQRVLGEDRENGKME